MPYFAEAWSLIKKTWVSLLKLVGVGLLLGVGTFAVTILLIIGLDAAGAGPNFLPGLLAVLLMGLLYLILFPVLGYAWTYLVSLPYYPGDARLWRVLGLGFRRWPRLVMLWLVGFLFELPFFVATLLIVSAGRGTLDPRVLADLPAGRQWLLSLVGIPGAVLGFYGTLASLNLIRLGYPAWRAWMKAFRLIPARDWLGTVGTITGLSLVWGLTALFWPGPLGFRSPWWWSILTYLVWFYLSFCQVAVWRRYAGIPEALEVLPPLAEEG